MSAKPVLYLGDTTLTTAASYVAGVMSRAGIAFDYLPSDAHLTADHLGDLARRRLFIISDYLSSLADPFLQRMMVKRVEQGAGLLMIGGWESFCGKSGHWAGSPISDALPVITSPDDDRINCDQPALPVLVKEHEITRDLPWKDRPPTVGGLNRITPRPGSQVLLELQRFSVKRVTDQFEYKPLDRLPLLVVAQHGQGRTAALACDLAPHWVGGLIDWGSHRVQAQAAPGADIEVGSDYARFVEQLIRWTGEIH